MQPYFFPYLGYFQLMNACDQFVVYDNVKFTKKGWIHRNRMLMNEKDVMFSLSLKSDSDYLNISQRTISDGFEKEKNRILAQIRASYLKAARFSEVYPLVEDIFNCSDMNLYNFIFNSILKLKEYLFIGTPLITASAIDIDHTLKSKFRVIALCKKLDANIYINPIGGMALYDKDDFCKEGIDLYFHKMREIVYPQFAEAFVPSLSILDVLMFNSIETVREYLFEFDLI